MKGPFFYSYVWNKNFNKIYLLSKKKDFDDDKFRIFKNFYKKPTLEVLQVHDLPELKKIIKTQPKPEKIILLVNSYGIDTQLTQAEFKYKLIYENIPEWSKKFNINNWQSRSQILCIYEIYP